MIKNYSNPEKIIIDIGADEQKRAKKRNSKKSLLPTRRENDYLARRKKKVSGINFYDLGQIFNGSIFIDKTFTADGQIGFDGTNVSRGEIDIADINTLSDTILAVDLADFTAKYKKITTANADDFLLRVRTESLPFFTLSADSEYWSSDGNSLRLPPADLGNRFEVFSNPFFNGIQIRQTGGNKVCATPDFAAAEVSFSIQGNETIFLLPSFCTPEATTTGILHQSRMDWNDNLTFVANLYPDYLTFPRLAFLPYYADFRAIGGFRILLDTRFFNFPTRYNSFYEHSDYLQGKSATLHYIQENGTISYFNMDGDLITEPVQETFLQATADFPFRSDIFPAPPAAPVPNDNNTLNMYNGSGQYRASWSTVTKSGTLLAVIKQGNTYFYVFER